MKKETHTSRQSIMRMQRIDELCKQRPYTVYEISDKLDSQVKRIRGVLKFMSDQGYLTYSRTIKNGLYQWSSTGKLVHQVFDIQLAPRRPRSRDIGTVSRNAPYIKAFRDPFLFALHIPYQEAA